MAVAIDVDPGTDVLSTSSASPHTYTGLTTGGPLTNGGVTFIVIYDTHVTGSSATWDSVACVLAASGNNTGTFGRVEIWALSPLGTHTGNKTFSVSWTGGGNAQTAIVGLSWTGVDQTGGTTSFPNGTSHTVTTADAGTAVSATITSATGDACVAGFSSDAAVLNTLNNTTIKIDNAPSNISCGFNRGAGAASVVLSCTNHGTASTAWIAVGVDIKAATAGGSPLRRNASLDGLGASGPFFSNPLARSVLGWRPSIVAVKRKLIVPPRRELRLAA